MFDLSTRAAPYEEKDNKNENLRLLSSSAESTLFLIIHVWWSRVLFQCNAQKWHHIMVHPVVLLQPQQMTTLNSRRVVHGP